MNYLEWNNAIGEFYFNEDKAEEEVFLYITQEDIVGIGKQNGVEGNHETIFKDYISAIKRGIPGINSTGNILDRAIYCYDKWKQNLVRIDGIEIRYPLYLGYLALFVMPLTKRYYKGFRSDAYYPRMQSFLKQYDLPKMPYQNEHHNWNVLWEDLFHWSFEVKNTELGYFELHPFKNDRWIYVGKPLSQSIFPIRSLKSLPQFFETSGLVPNENLTNDTIIKLLSVHGKSILNLPKRVIGLIKEKDNDLGHSILGIVKKAYQNWTGTTDQQLGDTEEFRKGNTISHLRLCLEGDTVRGFKIYYRLFSSLDFPEDLCFDFNGEKHYCRQIGQGWSKPLYIPFQKELDLFDNYNKWKAKIVEKDIRILVDGKNFNLAGWVEVPSMIASRMLVLTTSELSNAIKEWGELFSKGNFKEISNVRIPEGFTLFEIKNPPIEHPDIPALQFKNSKTIKLTHGLKVGVRTWLKDLLPIVELENGRGNEKVYLMYENSEEKVFLKSKGLDFPTWLLPDDIKTNRYFFLLVEGYENSGPRLKNLIIDSKGRVDILDEQSLPRRDKFGQVINENDSDSYVSGSNLLTTNRLYRLRQKRYSPFFRPNESQGVPEQFQANELNPKHELLLTYLTVKKETSAKDYFEAFEVVYNKIFLPEEIDDHSIEVSKLKRWSLNYLDYMGFLDYEYSSKRIIVNPPQFILIPTKIGRKALLIGGRTTDLMEKLLNECSKEELKLEVLPQDFSLSTFILPSTVIVSGYDLNPNQIEARIGKVAERCSIGFNPDKLPQIRLAEFSGRIEEYEQQLRADDFFDDSGWPARVFDPEKLRFIPIERQELDKRYSLVEYRLTEYSFKHRLWINEISYPVNKGWGRFMILNKNNKNVFYNDRGRKIVAMPATLPLPRILSEAFVLYSGKAPKRLKLNLEGKEYWYNVYENIPHIPAHNTCLKIGQTIQEKTILL